MKKKSNNHWSKNIYAFDIKNILAKLKEYWFFKVLFFLFWPTVFILFILYYLPAFLPTRLISDGEVYGIVFQNQIWQGEIKVSGDLITVPGVTIQIRPGTKVYLVKEGDKFNLDFFPFHFKTGINTKGVEYGVNKGEPYWNEKEKVQLQIANLKASGTDNNPIVISSTDYPGGSTYDINLIKIRAGELSNVRFSNYRRLEIGTSVTITNSMFSNTAECAICVKFGNPIIEENTFQQNKKAAIIAEYSSPLISGNRFLQSEGLGIYFNGDSFANVKVIANFFDMPGKQTIKVDSLDQGGVIARNIFNSGNINLTCDSKVLILHNLIRGQIIFDNRPGCNDEYIFGDNFWEIKDAASIQKARIIGTTDQFHVSIPFVMQQLPADLAKF